MEQRCPLGQPREVAEYLAVTENVLAVWRHRGTGPRSYRAGKFVRYRWDDVDAWLEGRAAATRAVA